MEQHPLMQHPLTLGATAFTVAEIASMAAHFGPVGWLVGGIVGFVAYRHGSDIITGAKHVLTPVTTSQQTPWQHAWGIQPEQTTELATHTGLDKELVLYLGPNFLPDANMILAEGVFASGVKGSGKTGLLALISEQINRWPVPQVVFDKEGDLCSLVTVWTNGRTMDCTTWYNAEQIIEEELQVVVDLSTWSHDRERAHAITTLAQDLLAYTSAQAPEDRKPCPVFLDEAQYWLPEDRVSYLSREVQQELSDTFNILLSTGRKRGLTPFLFTQRIAQVQKSAINLGIQIFMRQVLDNDQKRCAEYIRADVLERRKLTTLEQGQGVVCLPGGIQLIVQFDERKSVHVSHSPGIERVGRTRRTILPAMPEQHPRATIEDAIICWNEHIETTSQTPSRNALQQALITKGLECRENWARKFYEDIHAMLTDESGEQVGG